MFMNKKTSDFLFESSKHNRNTENVGIIFKFINRNLKS